MSVVELERADVLLEEAQRAGYRYPPAFHGFRATLQTADATTEPALVAVSIGKDGVSVEGAEGLGGWAAEQIRSMVAHRLARPYEDGDGRHAKRAVDDGSPLGALVELEDGMSSSYRVAEGQIALVTRQPGPHRFSIAVQARLQVAEGAFLPKEFAVFHWGADGALEAAEAYSDVYAEVDELLLPASRRVIRADRDGVVSARQLTLKDHSLATEVAS